MQSYARCATQCAQLAEALELIQLSLTISASYDNHIIFFLTSNGASGMTRWSLIA